MRYFQQGDVLIKPCGSFGVFEREFDKIPIEAIEQNSCLVFRGVNNSHAIYGGKFKILDFEGVRFIRIDEPSTLDHVKNLETMERAEHNAIEIPTGEWFVETVNEYDHLKEESRKIID